MTLAPSLPAVDARPDPPRRPAFRAELQGLRAVAVLLVVCYHVWFGRISGGVDVFFVITGFLLVGRLVPAAAAGPLPLRAMWVRNAARLLPAAAVVLLATLTAAVLLLPTGRLPQTLREIVTSLLFVENWQLVADSVDYAARSNTSSVVQHFWSLSLQGQVLVAFPLLVALVATAGRGRRLRVRVAVMLGALTAASLAFSVVLTAADQPQAYFHSLTRIWEFGLGGLLALGVDRSALPRRVRVGLGWIGLPGLLACGAVLGDASVFPGIAALWPTGCAALVLLAGVTGSPVGVDRLLTMRPMRYIGDLSYSLYLWHWPVLIFTLVVLGRRQAGPLTGAAVVAVAVALAVATHHLVERPSGRRVAGAGLVAVLAAALGAHAGIAAAAPPVPRDERHPGALVLAGAAQPVPGVPALPPMLRVYDDWVRTDWWDCHPMAGHPRPVCAQPVDYEPQRRIAVVGDSHAQQYAGALEPLARVHHWQLISVVMPGCPFSTTVAQDGWNDDCARWNDAVLPEIAALRPDAVVTMASRDVRRGRTEVMPGGFVGQWERLDAMGIPVLAIRANPRFDYSPPDCLQRRGRENPSCGVARDAVYSPDPPWTRVPIPGNVTFLDTANLLCDATRCPAEVGNVLVYMDDNHISAMFAASLAPVIDRQVRDAFGW